MRSTFLLALAAVAACSSAGWAACPGKESGAQRSGRPRCAEPRTFEPYDPDRVRPGRRGAIDLGGGSEVRIGGRTSLDYSYTR